MTTLTNESSHAPGATHANKSRETFRPLIVVPTFNHAGSLAQIATECAGLGCTVIVVDDGSTDETPAVLERLRRDAGAHAIRTTAHPHNRGKAEALKTGFALARDLGATHVATIDADGQLSPADIPRLLDLAQSKPEALILGVRPREMAHCPGRCALGRSMTSLAIRLQTGVHLADTQCGLRVYPMRLLNLVHCRSARYAFEAEVITRAVWAGFEIQECPVSCRYFPPQLRISHWRPVRDSVRQGRLHLGLLARSLLPRPE